MEMIVSIIILIISVVFHECAHGWMAHRLGDDTAKLSGRLTLNPLKHLDIFGSVILPLFLVLTKANFMLAWAKPVPYNPNNLRDRKYGEMKVALAGPATNLILAIIFGLLARVLVFQFSAQYVLNGSLLNSVLYLSVSFCLMNLGLMLFNLIPLPPLDGSKILLAFLPWRWQDKLRKIEQYSMFILMFLIIFNLLDFIIIIDSFLFTLITGLK